LGVNVASAYTLPQPNFTNCAL